MRILITLCLMAVSPAALAASNYAEWNAMNDAQKTYYVAGVVDSFMIRFTTDSQYRSTDQDIMMKCIKNKDLTYSMATEQIDAFYAEHIDQWDYPPTIAFLSRFLNVGGVCDRERKEIRGE